MFCRLLYFAFKKNAQLGIKIFKFLFLVNQQIRGDRQGCERNFKKNHAFTDLEFEESNKNITNGIKVLISLTNILQCKFQKDG